MHYVIGDVHGCYDTLMELLKKIDIDDQDAIIFFVGDWIDRGPKVWETLMWAMEHITVDGKYRSVRGNHEVLALEWYAKWKAWKENGETFGEPKTEYGFYELLNEKGILSTELLDDIMDFFRKMPFSYLISLKENQGKEVCFRIAHAWHCYDDEATQEVKEYINTWIRKPFTKPIGEIVVHGHTPTVPLSVYDKEYERPGKIDYEEEGINVDGGCCYHYLMPGLPVSLCGICLETGKEYYCMPDS